MGADALIVTALDEVAWLLNVRGRDLPYARLLKAFVVVSMRDVRVFVPPGKLSVHVRDALAVYNCVTNNCTRWVASLDSMDYYMIKIKMLTFLRHRTTERVP